MALTAPEQAAVVRAVATTPSAYDGNAYETKFPSDLNDMGVMVPAVAREAAAAVAAGAEGTAGAATAITKAAEAGISAASAKSSQESASALAAAFEIDPVKRTKVPTTLDVRFEPGITPAGLVVSRATTGSRINARGLLETVAANALRHDFDPVTGAYRGVLIEEARTNGIRNSQGLGAALSVPNNWAISGEGGLDATVVGKGEESGFSYVDVRVQGTANTATTVILQPEASNIVVAAPNQIWTASFYMRLVSGSAAGLTLGTGVYIWDAQESGAAIGNTSTLHIPTTDPLSSQRVSATRTLVANTGRVFSQIRINFVAGAVVDLTLRVAAPQLEFGTFPTSYIPTTTAAVTRAADGITMPVGDWYNPVEGALLIEAIAPATNLGHYLFQLGDDTGLNNLFVVRDQFDRIVYEVYVGPTPVASLALGLARPGQLIRVALRWKADSFAASLNGGDVFSDTSGAVPTPATNLRMGHAFGGAKWGGPIRRVAAFPRSLSNPDLQAMSRIT